VLLGATVIPVWARHHRLLPFEFGISSLGAAVALVEFAGGFTPALNRAGLAAALGETVMFLMQRPAGPAAVNQQTRVATMLAGPVGACLRLISLLIPAIRPLAAICAIAGSALLRFGWIAAGRSSDGRVTGK
jgi:hypothetical protein